MMFFVLLSALLGCFCLLLAVLLDRRDKELANANYALRECQNSMMRGAAVERIRTRSTSPLADEWHFRILTHSGAIRLTGEQFAVAREREIRETK